MQLGFVGLGKMGLNMVTRLRRGGHEIVALDRSADAVATAEAAGARGAASLDALSRALTPPRAVWVMVPAGAPTESTIVDARPRCSSPATSIIDGGNTNFHDDVRRAGALAGQRHPLRRRRHERRHLGPAGGLLPDGRRRRRRLPRGSSRSS